MTSKDGKLRHLPYLVSPLWYNFKKLAIKLAQIGFVGYDI
jgi:hypothetical protein